MFLRLKINQLTIFAQLFFFWSVISLAWSMQETTKMEDPAFFRLKVGDRDVYVLGSPHHIPLADLLSKDTLEEIARISKENPIFYTEHEITNRINLEYLKKGENLIGEDTLKYGNTFTYLGIELSVKEIELIKDISLFVNLHDAKGEATKLKEIINALPWLSAVILGTHAGILSYKRFGGTEYDLEYKDPWKNAWSEKLFLETPEEVIEIMKAYEKETKDDAQNQMWAKKSIEKIIVFQSESQTNFDKMFAEQKKSAIKHYSWQCLKGDHTRIPQSALARNKLWVSVVQKKLETDDKKTPLFIVVGTGHLCGYKTGSSFIDILIKIFSVNKLERFTNEKGWIAVD